MTGRAQAEAPLGAPPTDPAGADPAYVHVAIDGGELFAVRDERFTVIGIADRFSLASLILCDLRAALRRLEPAPA